MIYLFKSGKVVDNTKCEYDDTYLGYAISFPESDTARPVKYKVDEVYLRNDFWIELLMSMGYKLYFIPDTCPYCITVERFAEDHPEGRYLLGTGSHVIACINGDYIDTWNSGRELPIYYLAKESCYD